MLQVRNGAWWLPGVRAANDTEAASQCWTTGTASQTHQATLAQRRKQIPADGLGAQLVQVRRRSMEKSIVVGLDLDAFMFVISKPEPHLTSPRTVGHETIKGADEAL
jgi:hypothetical protein